VKKLVDGGGKDYYLVDVLSEKSFEGIHIPTSHNIAYAHGFAEVFAKALSVPKDAKIIVYCASSGCQLSHLAADELEKAGYTNVYHYADGLAGWKNAGYEFESV